METKIKDKTKLCWDFGGTKFETIAIMCLLNFLLGTGIRMSKKSLGEDGRGLGRRLLGSIPTHLRS